MMVLGGFFVIVFSSCFNPSGFIESLILLNVSEDILKSQHHLSKLYP